MLEFMYPPVWAEIPFLIDRCGPREAVCYYSTEIVPWDTSQPIRWEKEKEREWARKQPELTARCNGRVPANKMIYKYADNKYN